MNILIVEDGKDKRHKIRKTVREMGYDAIDVAKTYFSARDKIVDIGGYDLIILDMFLPDAEDDKELRGLAGKDLIFDIMDEGIEIPIIVVTQYTEYTNNGTFGEKRREFVPKAIENKNFGKEPVELSNKSYDCTYYEGLHEYLSDEIPLYLGIVFYSNQNGDWKNDLRCFIEKTKEEI